MKETKQQKEDLKKLRNRINWFCDHKINAFSATISPAPKSQERGEIESILEGLGYYFKRGITEMVVQRKYMGSYCDIYLHKNLEQTYFVSRNGHRIQHIDLDAAIAACKSLYERFNWDGLRLVIIQSELMPWSVLGRGLIEDEFEGYLDAHQNHLSFLQNSDLYEKINRVKEEEPFAEFIRDKQSLCAKDLKQKYPVHIIRQYTAMEQFPLIDLEQYGKGIAIYEQQIRHFGQEHHLYFKPFNILKEIYDDGTERLINDNLSYKTINDDEMLELKIDSAEDLEREAQRVYSWFATLTEESEEGLVIKPRQAFIKEMPPALKVRNNHYLTMIYGVDFQKDLEQHIRKRSIGKKLSCSINDWMLNQQMLAIPYDELHGENYYLKNLVYDRIIGERDTTVLDTRL